MQRTYRGRVMDCIPHQWGEQAWSTPIAKDVLISNYHRIKFTLIIYTSILSSLLNFLCLFLLDRYIFLFEKKYRDTDVTEQPAFDKKLWKQDSMERNAGCSSRKQSLGGLDPYYSEESIIGSSAVSTAQYPFSTQASASIDPNFFSSQLSQMATTLEEGLSTKISTKITDEIHALEDRLIRQSFMQL